MALPFESAGSAQFVITVRQIRCGGDRDRGARTDDDRGLDANTRLSRFVCGKAQMVIGRHANAELAPVVHLRPVVRNVPSELRVLDDMKPGSDVRAAIAGIPQRNRPLLEVRVVACQYDLLTESRSLHEFRLDTSAHALADEAEQFFICHAECLRQTAPLTVDVDYDAVAPAFEAIDLRHHSRRPGAVGEFAANAPTS